MQPPATKPQQASLFPEGTQRSSTGESLPVALVRRLPKKTPQCLCCHQSLTLSDPLLVALVRRLPWEDSFQCVAATCTDPSPSDPLPVPDVDRYTNDAAVHLELWVAGKHEACDATSSDHRSVDIKADVSVVAKDHPDGSRVEVFSLKKDSNEQSSHDPLTTINPGEILPSVSPAMTTCVAVRLLPSIQTTSTCLHCRWLVQSCGAHIRIYCSGYALLLRWLSMCNWQIFVPHKRRSVCLLQVCLTAMLIVPNMSILYYCL